MLRGWQKSSKSWCVAFNVHNLATFEEKLENEGKCTDLYHAVELYILTASAQQDCQNIAFALAGLICSNY